MENFNPYSTRSYAITFEVPFIDLGDPTYEKETVKLISDINASYKDWFEVLVQSCELLNRDIYNPLLIYYLVARVDVNAVDLSTLEVQWDEMKSKVQQAIVDYLTSRGIEFEIAD